MDHLRAADKPELTGLVNIGSLSVLIASPGITRFGGTPTPF
jgi:hypothetical protein